MSDTRELEEVVNPVLTLEVVVNPDPMTGTLEVGNPVLMMVLAPKEVPREVMAVTPRDIRAADLEREAEKARNLDHMTALVLEKDLVNPVLILEAVANPDPMMDTLEVATEEEENLEIMTTMAVTMEEVWRSSTVTLSTVPAKEAALASDPMMATLAEEEVVSQVLTMDLAPKEVPREAMVAIPRDTRAAVPAKEAERVLANLDRMMALGKEVVNPVLTLEVVVNLVLIPEVEVANPALMMDTLAEEEMVVVMAEEIMNMTTMVVMEESL